MNAAYDEVPWASCEDCRWNRSVAAGLVEYVADKADAHCKAARHYVRLNVNLYKACDSISKPARCYGWTFSPKDPECLAEFHVGRKWFFTNVLPPERRVP